MTISYADLVFRKAQHLGDFPDSGGRMSGNVIAWDAENAIFADVTDIDRAVGGFNITKLYAAVVSANSDAYMDAGLAIFRAPSDPACSVLAFTTGDFYDTRSQIQAQLEQSVTRGPRYAGYLYGLHLKDQRSLLIWQRPESALPPVGMRLEIIAKAGSVEQYNQFLWITRVLDELRTHYDEKGAYLVRVVTCELAEPLDANYTGLEPSRIDPNINAATSLLHETRYNAEAVPIHGMRPLTEAVAINDFSVKIDSLYAAMVSTSLAETALPDVTPGGDSAALVAGNSAAVSLSTADECIKPDGSLYIGGPFIPGTLSISVSGATITDRNGAVLLAGTTIGSADYSNGVIRWNSACPNYATATKAIGYNPAGRPQRVADTAAQWVTPENRGYVWTITLTPIPSPGSLRIAYRAAGQWYVLIDQGNGLCKGANSSYGSATLLPTGTVTLTTGALPDVDSPIIYSWAVPVNYRSLGGTPLAAPVIRFKAAHGGIAPGLFSISWTDVTNAVRTLTDDGHGNLTGSYGTGAIRYATGDGWICPNHLPPLNAEFTLAYDYGAPYEQTFSHPARQPNGHLVLTLDHPNVRANTVEVEWNLLIQNYDTISDKPAEMQLFRPVDPIKISRDDGNGVLPITGGTAGSIVYTTATLDFLPDVTVSVPEADYSVVNIGTSLESGGTKPVYRNTFTGFVYKNAGATSPIDESGWVKVRYRTVGGDSHTTDTFVASQLELDLTKGFSETLVPGSLQFRLGTDRYVDIAGQLYRNPSPSTGSGTLAGSLDPSGGVARLSNWTPGAANGAALDSLVTDLSGQPLEEVVFRTPVAPIKSGSLQLRFTNLLGQAKSKTVDGTGKLEDLDCLIRVDYPLGIVRARFGLWKNDADLTPAEKLEPWYNPDARVDFAGTLKIWKPKPVLGASIVYNAVAQTFMPPDSALLGINAARLPPDGRALIFTRGRLVLIHHTATQAAAGLSPTQSIAVGRSRLYHVTIADSTGKRLERSQYAVEPVLNAITGERDWGNIVMPANLDLTGFTGPYTIHHTVADLMRLVDVDISGTLKLNQPLSHPYPVGSYCSGVLPLGTLQARVINLFAQSSWTDVWSDTRIGSAPIAQYDDALYPLIVSNLGAYPDRFFIQFTSTTAFRCIGEHLGVIGIGDINTDFAPINSLTDQPYFAFDHQGWGSGWSVGNILRFELIGACYPVDLIRALQPSQSTGTGLDSVELLFVGNVNA